MDITQATPGKGPISVTEPISRAVEWTRRVLFEPFDAGKWFTLGFCAWLAWLGERGGGGPGGRYIVSDDGPARQLETAVDWIRDHLPLAIVLAAVIVFFLVVLTVVVMWLSSRGKLMFLDGVIGNRGAVVEPWRRFREQAWSLFGFRLVLALVAFVLCGALVALLVASLVAAGVFEGADLGLAALLPIFAAVGVLLVVAIAFALINLVMNDLVVPIMWLRGSRVMAAWSEAWRVLSAFAGKFVLYVLMKIVLAILVGLIACIVTCVTCCIAVLPYIGTVILLPLYVFGRSYSIYFLSQFGPEYAPLAPTAAGPAAATAPPPAPSPGPPPPPPPDLR